MKKITKLKITPKILITLAIVILLIITAVFLSTQTGGGGRDPLSEAIEAGELTFTSVSRNYESLIQFVQNNETQARQLLEGARAVLENAKAKLNSVGHTEDDYTEHIIVSYLDNYQRVANASSTMAQGVDNLLLISENLTNAIYYYSQGDFESTYNQAYYCLQVLTPLLKKFEISNTTINGIDILYIPSGQRGLLPIRVGQYRNETEIYNQYILLLRSLLEGKDYLQKDALLEEYLRQLQSAIANNDYETAQEFIQKISDIFQSLQGQEYQDAAELASQLNPNLFSGTTSTAAQELRNRLRNLEGINAFENYLQSLEKYLEALRNFEQGETAEANQAINEGLGILEQGQGSDSELQGLYTGLREAFNTLQQNMGNPPPPG